MLAGMGIELPNANVITEDLFICKREWADREAVDDDNDDDDDVDDDEEASAWL